MCKKLPLTILCAAIGSTPAFATPPSFVDDLVASATYDRDALISACTTGIAPKWMVYSIFDGEIAYEQAIAANGRMVLNASKYMNAVFSSDGASVLVGRVDAITVGWHGLGLSGAPGFPATCLNEPTVGTNNMVFTDDDVCIYGGYSFNQFELNIQTTTDDAYGRHFGDDKAPGFAGVDDDGNGLTDDDANCAPGPDGQPGQAGIDDDGNAITDDLIETYWCGCGFDTPGDCAGANDDTLGNPINQSNMRRAGEYLHLGPDGCAGSCGVDDDGNGVTDWLLPFVQDYATYDDDNDGTTDEAGERQPDLGDFGFGDDPDDHSGQVLTYNCMRANVGAVGGACLMVDTSWETGQFQVFDVFFAIFNDITPPPDEIGPDFYQTNVEYSYAYCASGSCYGAQLWIGDDVANPVETLGPAPDTNHLNKSSDNEVGAIFIQANAGIFTPFSDKRLLGNKYLGKRYWVIQGPPGEEDIIVGSDRDADFDVDGVDFSIFASCFNGAGKPPRTLGCSAEDASQFDADGDNDVDGVDFSRFASCFNKAGNPPRAAGCIPALTACP